MPTPLSCKSASALDSLPRNANARRSGTALHRLQQQRLQQIDDFGERKSTAGGDGLGVTDSPTAKKAFPSSSALPRRSSSSNRFIHRRRKPSKSVNSQAIASDDLPLASSDLYALGLSPASNSVAFGSPAYDAREVFSDGEQVARGPAMMSDDDENDDENDDDDTQSIRVIRGGASKKGGPRQRALSLSPRKLYQPIMSPMRDEDEQPSRSHTPTPPRSASPTKRQQAFPARKRIVTKDMIGKPTNFQHTGHIGASSYGALSSINGDADKLKQQLSEVAAALRLDDASSLSSSTTPSTTRESSKGSESTLSETDTALALDDEIVVVKQTTDGDTCIGPSTSTSQNHMMYAQPSPPVVACTLERANSDASTVAESGQVKRTTSKRKPVPAPRQLVDLYGEFNSAQTSVPSEHSSSNETENQLIPTPIPTRIAEEDEEDLGLGQENEPRPVPTIRASNGKRMVQGPAGEYITDTANVRWNKALNEITLALKDDEGLALEEEEHDIQRQLQKADDVLRRLNAV